MFLKELRSLVQEILSESTPRIIDLEKEDIINLLEDILGREPLLSYTEKLAGQFLEIKIEKGEVLTIFKDAKEKGYAHGYRHDAGGTASTLRTIELPSEMEGETYQFEVIKKESRPDYIDYVFGDGTIAIEFSGRMTQELASKLNEAQENVRFMTRSDISRRPKALSPDLKRDVQDALNNVRTSAKIPKAYKERIESLVSKSLVEIFGESILGGSPEGVFVTGGSKPFKVPEREYASIQRLQAPIYAIFSEKSKYNPAELLARILEFSKNPKDRMAKQIADYLEAASRGFPPGFRTFFTKEEANELLKMLENVMSGDENAASTFYKTLRRRVNDKSRWVSTSTS